MRRNSKAIAASIVSEFYDELHSFQTNRDRVKKFCPVQILSDETMTEIIIDFLPRNRDNRMVLLAGKGHIIDRYGIVHRVERKIGSFAD